jgi:hypothetical protein
LDDVCAWSLSRVGVSCVACVCLCLASVLCRFDAHAVRRVPRPSLLNLKQPEIWARAKARRQLFGPLATATVGRTERRKAQQNNRFTERDGRKGPPAENKARCNRTNTPHSKATRRKAKLNQKPQTHTRGARQALTTSAEGRARPRIGARPAARVATYAPDRHRDALPRQRAMLSTTI